MKRLRKKHGAGIRFFHCGEYGENFGRPHYHAILFNFDFADKVLWKQTGRGDRLYISDDLSSLWPFGYSTIGDVTFESAAYVARYVLKKVTGDAASSHYTWIDPETGEVFERKPEYCTMSRRPGIGKNWYEKFKDDVYPSDFMVSRGVKMRPPKYFDSLYEAEFPDDFEKLKRKRLLGAKKHADNNTPERLKVREEVQVSKLKLLNRSL